MAMTLPMSAPSAGNSPASDDSTSTVPPCTPNTPPTGPILPHDQLSSSSANSASISQSASTAALAQMKRKPSRRANTAERRATHNAVERQRRETLNGRFLDLAALLPNLSQIRRPSKSSIVNSSIAYIHAARRHRLLASRELRLVKFESDALRRELNEWRDRAGLPRVEEPIRSEGFAMVLSGEVEVLAAVADDEDENSGQYDGDEYGEDDYGSPQDADEMRMPQLNMLKNANVHPFAHSLPPSSHGNASGMQLAHILPRPATHSAPIIASSPSVISFENPAMASLYEPQIQAHPFSGAQSLSSHHGSNMETEKVAAWNAQLYSVMSNEASNQQHLQQMQMQRGVYTPPATASSGPASSQYTDSMDQAFFVSFQRQQLAAMQQQQMGPNGHIFGSPDGDDTSSVGSGQGERRERSGSSSNGSGYGSPQHSSPPGNYEMPSVPSLASNGNSDFTVPRQLGLVGPPGSWGRDAGADGVGMVKQALTSPISVGGGGNNTGFAMMM